MSMTTRQPNYGGSRLARPGPSTLYANQALSRLVHELNASRIDEESDEDEGERTGMTAEAERPDRVQPRSSQRRAIQSDRSSSARHTHSQQTTSLSDSGEAEGSLAQSRRQKAAHTLKRRTRRLLYLISYYLSRFMHDLGSTSVTYRPMQFGIY
ncbi:hypothetical protein GGI19_003664 [Coemansia pectinata]|uniref:Uncharacterized protein n=1 Tax=Coemansia pectinata TaxID=1052879 RepID=A0A9W8LA39_9FUNG|nr:hypothetical protein GGI19_003664 [Coemansia pectinata]